MVVTTLEARLQDAWDRYLTSEISTSHFLKAVSNLYGPKEEHWNCENCALKKDWKNNNNKKKIEKKNKIDLEKKWKEKKMKNKKKKKKKKKKRKEKKKWREREKKNNKGRLYDEKIL